ncbi:hypothetical protein B0H11DRAFT_1954476 [Mycena galericulata]|nr:hypothetical protein B0H11DRAFT_1954476 [Mycena galericulata]
MYSSILPGSSIVSTVSPTLCGCFRFGRRLGLPLELSSAISLLTPAVKLVSSLLCCSITDWVVHVLRLRHIPRHSDYRAQPSCNIAGSLTTSLRGETPSRLRISSYWRVAWLFFILLGTLVSFYFTFWPVEVGTDMRVVTRECETSLFARGY